MRAWPVDGRARTDPERSTDALSEPEFQDVFVETVVRTALPTLQNGYAFPAGLDAAQGRRYHGTYLKYFSFFAWRFPSWLMAIADRCPYQDVRRRIIEDCVDEEVSDVDAGGRCHIDVLYDEAAACGISRAEIAATEPTPILLACVHALENFARTLGWEAAFAALSALEILQSEPATRLRAELLAGRLPEEELAMSDAARDPDWLSEHTDVPAEQLVFAALHAFKDQVHGGGELAMVVRYGATRATQEQMLWGARAGAQIYGLMRQEIDRLARAAVNLPPRVLTPIE